MILKRSVSAGFSLSIVTAAMSVPFAFAQHVDVSLIPIAAEQPIPPAGFPPLPNKLDLPAASQQASVRQRKADRIYGGGYIHDDSFRQVSAPATIDQRNHRAAKEPVHSYVGDFDNPPKAIIIDQSRTQDISIPDDAQPTAGGRSQSNFSKTKQQVQNRLIRNPFNSFKSRFGL